jgi:hypothetical protein
MGTAAEGREESESESERKSFGINTRCHHWPHPLTSEDWRKMRTGRRRDELGKDFEIKHSSPSGDPCPKPL